MRPRLGGVLVVYFCRRPGESTLGPFLGIHDSAVEFWGEWAFLVFDRKWNGTVDWAEADSMGRRVVWAGPLMDGIPFFLGWAGAGVHRRKCSLVCFCPPGGEGY